MLKVRFPHNLCIPEVPLRMMASIWIWFYQILTLILGH